MKNLSKNLVYNIIYQVLLYIIPFILTPYLSRTLGATQIGEYSYTYSIVYYFMLFTLLGINNYGVRKISKAKREKDALGEAFSSIYGLQLFLGLISLIVYNLVSVVLLSTHHTILLIHNLFLISAVVDINWFFFGIEKFDITVTRNAIIKVLSTLLIFMLVKSPDSILIYTIIMAGSTLLSQSYLVAILHKYINFYPLDISKSIKHHFIKCLVLFIPVIAYSIYRVMDKTMIGGIVSTTELGYYENAEKIINIPIGILTAIGTVMLPFMSKQAKKDQSTMGDKKNDILYRMFQVCFLIMIPMAFMLFVIAKDFTSIYFGPGFEKSGDILMLLSSTIIFATVANIIRTNYLIPNEKDKIYVASTIVGAVVNLILNLVLIKSLGAIGACIGTIAAEASVMFYQIIATRKNIDYKKVFLSIFALIIKCAIAASICVVLVNLLKVQGIPKIALTCIIFIILYIFINVGILKRYLKLMGR